MRRKLVIDGEELGWLEYDIAAEEAQITDLFVQDGHRRRGYGTRLLQDFYKELEGQPDIQEIHLEVRASNRAALALYQKEGFELIGKRADYYRNPTEGALLLKKQL